MGYVKRDSIQWIIGQVFEGQMTTAQKAKRDRAVMKNGGVLKTGIIRHMSKGVKIYEQKPEESETV